MSHPYSGIRAVLTTKHNKQNLVAPIFMRLGIEVIHHEWDTDQLGTFSGEVPRGKSQSETALIKARIGMSQKSSHYGIASEGSVGPDQALPIINSALEAIAWVDDVNGFGLIEYERGLEVVAVKGIFSKEDEIDSFLLKADFPNHALIIYPEGKKEPIYKGIRDRDELDKAIRECIAKSDKSAAVIESDLRAHMSPSRSAVIVKCAEKLVARLAELCPSCHIPGFGEVAPLRGLACEICGDEVKSAIKGVVLGCVKCDYRIENLNGREKVGAGNCPSCNP